MCANSMPNCNFYFDATRISQDIGFQVRELSYLSNCGRFVRCDKSGHAQFDLCRVQLMEIQIFVLNIRNQRGFSYLI